jgi:hypothetical protein
VRTGSARERRVGSSIGDPACCVTLMYLYVCARNSFLHKAVDCVVCLDEAVKDTNDYMRHFQISVK